VSEKKFDFAFFSPTHSLFREGRGPIIVARKDHQTAGKWLIAYHALHHTTSQYCIILANLEPFAAYVSVQKGVPRTGQDTNRVSQSSKVANSTPFF
jgi:hypothetical protein